MFSCACRGCPMSQLGLLHLSLRSSCEPSLTTRSIIDTLLLPPSSASLIILTVIFAHYTLTVPPSLPHYISYRLLSSRVPLCRHAQRGCHTSRHHLGAPHSHHHVVLSLTLTHLPHSTRILLLHTTVAPAHSTTSTHHHFQYTSRQDTFTPRHAIHLVTQL